MPNTIEQTNHSQIDLDIDAWLGAPGADSIISQEDKKKEEKPNIFTTKPVSLDFLDEDDDKSKGDEVNKEGEDNKTKPEDKTPDINNILEEINNESTETEEDKAKKAGRPSTDKSGLVEFFKKRIESKDMFAFDDYDENKQTLDEYLTSLSSKDLDELYTANIDFLKNDLTEKTPKEFFDSLPQELQYAYKYVADGGQDIKGLFQALAHVEQTRELNPSEDGDQEQIVRQYLLATGFGSEEEINEEITTWKDLNVLSKKATQFKPKLDKMQEEIVAQRLVEQEEKKIQQQKASDAYVKNVFEALRPGEINGIKLDKTVQSKLYNGLVQPQYPSISGRPTNLLGHLLEKYQFVEPNYSLIAEALYLLSDPDEYRKTIGKAGKNQATEDIARKLKTEQANKSSSTNTDEDKDINKARKIARTPTDFFKR